MVLRALICAIFIAAMVRLGLAKAAASKQGKEHKMRLPGVCSLSQLPCLLCCLFQVAGLIAILVSSRYQRNHISPESGEPSDARGGADGQMPLLLWVYGIDYVFESLTMFILLLVARKTAISLLKDDAEENLEELKLTESNDRNNFYEH